MATLFTHAVVAGSTALFLPGNVPVARFTIVAVILSVIPDLDIISFSLGIPYGNVFGHRGFTHSIGFSVLAATAGTTLFQAYTGSLTRSWFRIWFLLFLACISHGILDAFTNAGLGVGFFIPLDNSRYFFPWRPLETSPIGISRFFRGDVLRILSNEIRWVWSPTLLFVICTVASKKYARK